MKTLAGHDLTMPLDGAVTLRHYQPTLVLRSQTTLDGLQRISDLRMFPHTSTHIDLLSRIDWNSLELGHLLEDGIHQCPNHPKHNEPLLHNRAFPCTVVSLDSFAASMSEACHDVWNSRLPRHPSRVWPRDVFVTLLRELRITKAMLQATEIHKGSFTIFHTRWREFAPSDGDLTHPVWYPWHPYLMNPYLDEEAVLYLLDEADGCGVPGIGCDISTLEGPLRHMGAHDETHTEPKCAIPYLSEVAGEPEFCPASHLPAESDVRFWPIHVHVLSKLRLLVEQLHVPPDLKFEAQKDVSGGFPSTHGKLVLLPCKCTGPTDATLAHATFIPEAVEHGQQHPRA